MTVTVNYLMDNKCQTGGVPTSKTSAKLRILYDNNHTNHCNLKPTTGIENNEEKWTFLEHKDKRENILYDVFQHIFVCWNKTKTTNKKKDNNVNVNKQEEKQNKKNNFTSIYLNASEREGGGKWKKRKKFEL